MRSVALVAAAAIGLHASLAVGAASTSAGSTNSLPDWSGTWQAEGSVALLGDDKGRMFVPGTRDHPPLKPEYERQYRADLVRAEHQGDPNAKDVLTDTNTLHCFAGMPRVIAAPFPYEFLVTPRETWIIIDKAVRHVFTDGRGWPPPDARWPLMLGRSKGRWESGTLVIETVDMRDDMWLDTTPLMLSSKASVIERIRKVDANTLEDQVTIRDPVKFTQDWHFTRRYVRIDPHEWPDDPELCGGPEDRNPIVNGRVTVKLPQDAPKKPPRDSGR
jgi:hypothetical protein